jgi:hypothetical protein
MTNSLKSALAAATLATSLSVAAGDTQNLSEQVTRGKAGLNGYFRGTYTLAPSNGDMSKKNMPIETFNEEAAKIVDEYVAKAVSTQKDVCFDSSDIAKLI